MIQPAKYRAKVRMYRGMLGDSLLITLPRSGSAARPYWIMIDCGAVLGTTDAAAHMQSIVRDIAAMTNGTIDLLVVTHEHWDHLSGFVQAKDDLAQLTFNTVWLAWTENRDDDQARKLAGERANALRALQIAQARLRLAGDDDTANELDDMVGSFFGAAAGATTADAMEAVRHLSSDLRYCEPGQPPWTPPETSARLYVLGPPRDEKLLKKYAVSASSPEVYGIGAASQYMQYIAPALQQVDPESPFDVMQVIPMTIAEEMPFFRQWYFGSDVDHSNGAAPWRRIDGAWLQSSPELALQLDSATNNTSLVLAIELEGGDVLLFPGDAQIGSWESWQTLQWDGGTITGPELLKRCVFYKVGHHGSHNATLRENGLETMNRLQAAMVPVDHATAVKKHWDRIPLPALIDALDTKTHHNVIQADHDAPHAAEVNADKDGLWYEVTL